jgi:hypothetical protein
MLFGVDLHALRLPATATATSAAHTRFDIENPPLLFVMHQLLPIAPASRTVHGGCYSVENLATRDAAAPSY